jgi:hypothetical protein
VVEVGRASVARPVEVDDVEVARALVDPAPGGVHRVCVVDRLVVVVAAQQPHRVPAANVDRGIEDHAAE